jgi:hypothetical protein
MRRKSFLLSFLIFFDALLHASIELSSRQMEEIGNKIWHNECNSSKEGLTSWNLGENFLSCGIGHFIWYVKDKEENFEESFPKLVKYIADQGVELPKILKDNQTCPWNSRQEFLDSFHKSDVKELRDFLEKTKDLQAKYICISFETTFQKILDASSDMERKTLMENFNRLKTDPRGVFALIDYHNFKGSGISIKEAYNQQGWGLKQVLLTMQNNEGAIDSFKNAAEAILKKRVENAPLSRNENRWLLGWINRISAY